MELNAEYIIIMFIDYIEKYTISMGYYQNPSRQNPINQNPINQNPINQNPSRQNHINQNPSNQNPTNQKIQNEKTIYLITHFNRQGNNKVNRLYIGCSEKIIILQIFNICKYVIKLNILYLY